MTKSSSQLSSEFSIKEYYTPPIDTNTSSLSCTICEYKDIPKMNFDFEVYLPTYGINLQRELCWTLPQKQEYIRSIFKRLYLPPVFIVLHKEFPDQDYYEKLHLVIDGKQRITTIVQYLTNEFPLPVMGNDYYFHNLDQASRKFFAHRDLTGMFIFSDWDQPVDDLQKIIWFNYINFAGTPQAESHRDRLVQLVKNNLSN